MVQQHKVSRDANDGSRDDMRDNGYDEQRYESRDQRADTWTTFYESDINALDIPERRKKRLRRALRRQEGEDYGESYSRGDDARKQRKQQNREEWKRRIITTYATALDMTPAQQKRAKHLFLDVLVINTFGPYASEEVALGVLNVVAREDGWQLEDNEKFHELMVECGITLDNDDKTPSMGTMRNLRRLVRERVPSMTA
jgi:hypothetical protein